MAWLSAVISAAKFGLESTKEYADAMVQDMPYQTQMSMEQHNKILTEYEKAARDKKQKEKFGQYAIIAGLGIISIWVLKGQ